MEQFNVTAFLFINQYAGKNSLLDQILIKIAGVTPYVFILILAYLWFSTSLDNKRSSVNAGLSVLLGMLTSFVISLFYYHSRPFVDNLGTQLVQHAADSSFPSDHTTFIFCIAVMLLFNKATRVLGVVLCAVSVVSGFSRVYVGVHFPLDIVSAIFVAIFSSVLVYTLRDKTAWLLHFFMKTIPFSKIRH